MKSTLWMALCLAATAAAQTAPIETATIVAT